MTLADAKTRVEQAVDRILRLPAGLAELGIAMFVVGRSDDHWVGRCEALKVFKDRLDQLDQESRRYGPAQRAAAMIAMESMVAALESAGRGEYRLRDSRA
jgi:hypothetical protein